MLLDEIKLMAKRKYESIKDDPNEKDENKKFAAHLIKYFDNVDAVIESPKSLVLDSLFFIGYEHKDIRKIYDELMEELNKKYTLVHPDMVQGNGGNHK